MATTTDDINEAFAAFDKDGDGSISAADLGKVLGNLGTNYNAAELQGMVDEFDHNKSGRIEVEEFHAMMAANDRAKSPDDVAEQMRREFRMFDLNGDGFISPDELTKVMDSIGEKLTRGEITQLIESADHDKDGKVSYEEFILLSTGGAPPALPAGET